MLTKQGRCRASGSVGREVRNAEVESLEEVVQRSVAERHCGTKHRREHVGLRLRAECLQQPEEFECLSGKVDTVRRLHLHTLGRDVPLGPVEVELAPPGSQHL
jgi:hypothetical protein